MDTNGKNKGLIAALGRTMYDFEAGSVRRALMTTLAADAKVRFCHPFGDLTGPAELYDRVYAPLFAAVPDLERRDYIRMAGTCGSGGDWVGCGGFYTGTFVAPWLDIPPTGHQIGLRFHEFFRIEAGQVVEIQALWDLPEVMMQARAWPLAPSLGREWQVPGPATQDGLVPGPYDAERAAGSCRHVLDMLAAMSRHPAQGGPELMEMDRYWHPRMTWYGPAGIGTGRGVAGFRHWHQIPFLTAMPDRGQYADQVTSHFFGDGDYVGVTGWPNMIQTLTHDGWMSIAPGGRRLTLRSLDFWRLEGGRIRENWVLVDLLDVYRQLGVDVFARIREFNKARVPGRIPWPPSDPDG